MKKFIKSTLIVGMFASALIYNTYQYFDKPIQSCEQYVQENKLGEGVCGNDGLQ